MNAVLRFQGPYGAYDVGMPQGQDRPIEVVHGDKKMRWTVEARDEARNSVSGLTLGSEAIWGDVFWFELVTTPPAHIDYYGAGMLVRTDYEAKP